MLDDESQAPQEDARPRSAPNIAGIPVEHIESGIDWITMILEQKADQERALEVAMAMREEDLRAGDKLKPFTFQGYTGWRTASVRVGTRTRSMILLSTSSAAGFTATHLRSCTGRVTRLDVQTTLRLSSSLPSCATRFIGRGTASLRSPRPSQTRFGLSRASDGLCIGTVGRRTAPRYLRVYDKGVEERTHKPGYRWRIELEAKGPLARELWRDYQTARDVPEWCFESLKGQWKSSGSSWPLRGCSRGQRSVVAPKRGAPPAHALMAWLQTTVRPTIPRVLQCFTTEELVKALGLEEHVVTRRSLDDL